MLYRKWVISQELSRRRKHARDQTFRRVERIIRNNLTKKKQLSDFPAVDKYLSSKFPNIELSSILLYVAPPRVIEKVGWKDIGGCYIREKKVILVKNEIIHHHKAKGKFQRMMRDSCVMKADVEDVVVHEFIHAISDIIGRSLSKYQHMEEEFVYTNCIDFYHQKGMTDDDIVDNNFLPLCLQDIYKSFKEMKNIFKHVNHTVDVIRQMAEDEYEAFLNKYANELVPLIRSRAQEKAHKIIELYHKYGARMHKTSSTEVVEDKTAMRFSSLDLE